MADNIDDGVNQANALVEQASAAYQAKDYAKAVELYCKAADIAPGNADAMRNLCNLGAMYEVGTGVRKDAAKAAELYRKAAENGSAMGMRKLGKCYRDGTGVAQDFAEAEQWFNKAIANGDEYTTEELAKLKEMMSKKMIQEACKHEWEETGGHAEDTADHLTMIFLTDYKCKLCGKTTDSIDHVHDH